MPYRIESITTRYVYHIIKHFKLYTSICIAYIIVNHVNYLSRLHYFYNFAEFMQQINKFNRNIIIIIIMFYKDIFITFLTNCFYLSYFDYNNIYIYI